MWPGAGSEPGLPVLILNLLLPKEMDTHGWCLAYGVLVCLAEGLSLITACTVPQDALMKGFLIASHYNHSHIQLHFLAGDLVC